MKPTLIAAALLTLGGCYTPAPPPAATAEVAVLLDAQAEALARASANSEKTNATWAAELAKAKRASLDDLLERRVRALVEAATDTRPDPEAILREIRQRDEVAAANDAELKATLEKLRDANLATAAEIAAVARSYVAEMTERDRRMAQVRALLKIKEPTP